MEYRIVLLPILLILLFCLYYSNFKSNMVIMLSLIIVLVIFDLLNNTEYFEDVGINTKIFNLTDSEINGILKEQSLKISNLENMLKIVNKYKSATRQKNRNLVYPNIPLSNSCIMLDSDGNSADAIPKISSGNDIYSSENPFYHSLGRDHTVYNNIISQLTNN